MDWRSRDHRLVPAVCLWAIVGAHLLVEDLSQGELGVEEEETDLVDLEEEVGVRSTRDCIVT